MDSPLLLAIILVTFFAAGMVKGITGMGLPTVAMGVLGALISPLAAASLLIVPTSVSNLWQLLMGPHFWGLVRRLWAMMLAIIVGTLGGTALLTSGDTRLSSGALGAILVVYALFTLLARPFHVPARMEGWLSPIIGLATGIIGGGTGVFVIPSVPYLQAIGLEKDDLVQALGLSFTVCTFALAAGLIWHGALDTENIGMSTLVVVPALVGMWAGQKVRDRISPALFRKVFLWCLLVLGTEMVLRAVL